jgi:hypothetical protein
LLPSASQLAASKKPQKPKHRSPLLLLLPLPLLLLSLLRTLLLPPLALLQPLLLLALLLLLPRLLRLLHLLLLQPLLLQPLRLLLQPSLQKHRRSNFSVLASQNASLRTGVFFRLLSGGPANALTFGAAQSHDAACKLRHANPASW